MTDNPDRASIDSLLQWWTDAGVDTMLSEEPRDWLKPVEIPPPTPAIVREAEPAPPPAPVFPDQLPLFIDWLRAGDALPYAAPGLTPVCPIGDPASDLMILVPMPSQGDCSENALLTGPAGRLLDRMLAAIGRSRDDTYIAALSCLRPAGGRFEATGFEGCATIARHHVDLARPKAVLLMGDACSRAFTGKNVTQARGKVHRADLPSGEINLLVTMTVDFLLDQPSAKAFAWADLRLLMEILQCRPALPSSSPA